MRRLISNNRPCHASLIGDDDPDWRPDRYETALLGNTESLHFGMIKLLDYEEKWSELEQNPNPFAVVVMAHLKALRTQNKNEERFVWKKTLIKELYKRQYSKQDIFNLFRFIDWVMKLPEMLETQIQLVVDEYEEEHNMRYVTSIERMAMDRGHQKGLEEGKKEGLEEGKKKELETLRAMVLKLLRHRFPVVEENAAALVLLLQPIEDESILKQIIDLTLDAESLGDFMAKLQPLLPPPTPATPTVAKKKSRSAARKSA